MIDVLRGGIRDVLAEQIAAGAGLRHVHASRVMDERGDPRKRVSDRA